MLDGLNKMNMKSFIDLLDSNILDVSNLISHEFDLLDAQTAYNMIIDKNEQYAAIIINYDIKRKLKQKIKLKENNKRVNSIRLGVVGAGSFAQAFLLPNLKDKCNFVGLVTGSGNSSAYVGKKFDFKYLTNDSLELIADDDINTILIATRNNLHSSLIIESIKNNKHIYTEKPLAIKLNELDADIKSCYNEDSFNKSLMIGFNRRFSPAIKDLLNAHSSNAPKSILIRVNNKKTQS